MIGGSQRLDQAMAHSGLSLRYSLTLAVGLTLLSWSIVFLLRRYTSVKRWSKELRQLIFPAIMVVTLMAVEGFWWLRSGRHIPVLVIVATVMIPQFFLAAIRFFLRRHMEKPEAWLLAIRLLGFFIWVLLIVFIIGLIPDVAQFMGDTTIKVGRNPLSLQQIVDGLLILTLALAIASMLALMCESYFKKIRSLNPSVRVILSHTAWATFLVLAVLIGLSLAGIDLTLLSVLGGALAVGVGFGLQRIAANYVSGFSVLLDRSVQIGQTVGVQVGNREFSGVVDRIAPRYTVLREATGREFLVPNEMLVVSVVAKDLYEEAPLRQTLTLNITFESNLHQAMEILLHAAQKHPMVKSNPPPEPLVKTFEGAGIRLELVYFIENLDSGPDVVRSDLYCTIWKSFVEQGITMPVIPLGPPTPIAAPSAAQ